MVQAGQGFWRNPPPYFEQRGSGLLLRTGPDTDFWNRTFYDFTHGNGHLFAHQVTGDFSAETTFTGKYEVLYDQAGLMVWVDNKNWLKAGVEYADGQLNFSVVVTRDDQSDWSMLPLALSPKTPLEMRLTRHAEALRVQLKIAERWQLTRLAYLQMPEMIEVGPMACTPQRAGLEVEFTSFSILEPISRDLHA